MDSQKVEFMNSGMPDFLAAWMTGWINALMPGWVTVCLCGILTSWMGASHYKLDDSFRNSYLFDFCMEYRVKGLFFLIVFPWPVLVIKRPTWLFISLTSSVGIWLGVWLLVYFCLYVWLAGWVDGWLYGWLVLRWLAGWCFSPYTLFTPTHTVTFPRF